MSRTAPDTLAAVGSFLRGFGPDPDGGTRAGFSATGEINRVDFGVYANPPIVGLASAKVQFDIEAEAVLRKEE
jgi:polyisoprenoid-binding protein YceI